jgi:hypothetical protein
MIEVTPGMIDDLEHEIKTWLAQWSTPDGFADYAEDDHCTVALQILVDCVHGIYIARRAAERLDVALTAEDLQYDDGWEALEEGAGKLAQQIQSELGKRNLPGSVYFGTTDSFGDYALLWTMPIDDLPYPPS